MKLSHAIKVILDDLGYESIDEYCNTPDAYDSIGPGICWGCEEITYECEPDATNNYCESCGENKVISITELLMQTDAARLFA